jgi:hypothetical protein
MASDSKSTSSRAKVSAHRARLRAQGLKPVQIWLPDVRSPAFKAEAERQARLVAMDPHEPETMAFIEAAADWGGKE